MNETIKDSIKKTYAELLAMGKEALDAVKAPFLVKKAHKDLEMEMLKIEQKIAEANVLIQNEKSSNPPVWSKIGDAIDNKELLERQLRQYKELEKELFN